MNKSYLLLALLWVGFALPALAQDDLLGQLEQDAKPAVREPVAATFKSTRLINGHTVETPGEGTLVFLIGHRFGKLNDGAYNFFGLDQATVRLGLEYALSDRLELGVGRSSFEKTLDGFLKYRLVRQSTGAGAMPASLTFFASSAVMTLRNPNLDLNFTRRSTYTFQALLARKFNTDLSLQLMPTLVHRNLVMSEADKNDVYALGGGGRYKITKRLSINAEYYYLLGKNYTADNFKNSLALGLDIETGGHIFQLHVTNSAGMIEKQFITQTNGDFFGGDIYFGFNVNRNFTIKRRR